MKKIYSLVLLAGLTGAVASASCVGDCGTDTANGVVAPFTGFTTYDYVTTTGGAGGAGEIPSVGGTNGSLLTSATFTASVGDALDFDFDFVTSDGSGFADYAWAALEDTNGQVLDYLFTARTEPSGTIAPGVGLPADSATLTPATVGISSGTTWNELGSYSGACYAAGCGNTGWIQSAYTITAGDLSASTSGSTLQLAFGVTNWLDTAFDTGMAIDGATDAGNTIATSSTPEPASMALIGSGLAGLYFVRRRRKA